MSYLDTRDLYYRMIELQERDDAECDDCFGCVRSINGTRVDLGACRPDPLDDGEVEELDALLALCEELGGEVAMRDGDCGPMIPEDQFEDYARELADDVGAIDTRNYSWPASHVDWEAAAEALASDYTIVTYECTDYYVRSC